MSGLDHAITEVVRELYEDLPYPPVDPQDELNSLKVTYADYPALLNHYGWQGKKRFDRDFRILIAGGGTGNSAIYLAEQYGSMGAEVVYVDLSSASMAIAEERARLRRLDKPTFHRASLFDIPSMGLGAFDFIECSGVLHHLPDPDAGLAALASVLKDDGVLSIMVYGQHGRTAIYQMQRALHLALAGIEDRPQRIALGREMVNHLCSTNWFLHNPALARSEIMTDEGFADLLLHPRDRAYTVPQLYDWLKEAGLELRTFLDPYTSARVAYDPARYFVSLALPPQFETLSLADRQELAELGSGAMIKHSVYAARHPLPLPDPADESYVPVWCFSVHKMPPGELSRMVASATGPQLIFQLQDSPYEIRMTKNPATVALLAAIDERRTIGEVIAEAAARTGLPEAAAGRDFRLLYDEFTLHDLLFLRHSDVPPYVSPNALHAAMLRRRAEAGAKAS